MPGDKTRDSEVWRVRKNRGPILWVSAPGAKHYDNSRFRNHSHSFVNLSVTGEACALNCGHCRARLLKTMIPVPWPDDLCQAVDHLCKLGCRGILVSGGADRNGEVPLLPFIDALAYARDRGLQVLVHSGLLNRATALGLKKAGVNQVLMDILGDEDTIRQVYHLQRKPQDYQNTMLLCREVGLMIAPHLVVGLHYGEVRGEWKALEMIKNADPQVLVTVVLTPMAGTDMAAVTPPPVQDVASLLERARLNHPDIPVNLGCSRPAGNYKRELEIAAIDCGVDAIAYPDIETLVYAESRGLNPQFTENCCSLAALPDNGEVANQ